VSKVEPSGQKDKMLGIVKEEEVCVCFNLRKAARIVTQVYDEVMRPVGYRATQVTLLGVVSKYQPMTVKRLSEFMETDPTTLLRNLRLLERDKLLTLTTGDEDRRERYVNISRKGTQILLKAYPLWKKTQDRIAELVGRDRLSHLLDDLGVTLEMIRKG